MLGYGNSRELFGATTASTEGSVICEISQVLTQLLYKSPQLILDFRKLRAGHLSTILKFPMSSTLGRGLIFRKFYHCSIKLGTSVISQESLKEGNSSQMGGQTQNEDALAPTEEERVLEG
ncbi:hypothetical protein PDJAM_G00222810 [Pangasius djambal]|uniref:Uncharacterized protein n=1 Tax=Pangasius djambal TaxID=1691987 RepID=A0ACC5YCK9_9TELE|nr:hypothetical protein [Pangasius djambal]